MNSEDRKKMEAMLAKQEAEFKDIMKDKEFRDLGGDFELVDPEMAELHKEMQRQGMIPS
jgi:hypothetical protein